MSCSISNFNNLNFKYFKIGDDVDKTNWHHLIVKSIETERKKEYASPLITLEDYKELSSSLIERMLFLYGREIK